MANIIVLEIDNKLITTSIEKKILELSKFYEKFNNKSIIILYERNISDVELYSLVENKDISISVYLLNSFARNRLMNNFENERPELTLTLMGASIESKLIKVWTKNVER